MVKNVVLIVCKQYGIAAVLQAVHNDLVVTWMKLVNNEAIACAAVRNCRPHGFVRLVCNVQGIHFSMFLFSLLHYTVFS